jgi:hypothetical protein
MKNQLATVQRAGICGQNIDLFAYFELYDSATKKQVI